MDLDAPGALPPPGSIKRPFQPPVLPFSVPIPIQRPKMAPIPASKPASPGNAKREGEPPTKKSKHAETFNATNVHSTSPIPRSLPQSPLSSTTGDGKSKEAAPKKKPAARTKKITEPAVSPATTVAKKTESATAADTTPLRASNKAALEAMGLSWKEPRYQPHPSLHPMKVGLATNNSSKRVHIAQNIAVNGRGYNLTRANYPAQVGKWYYELCVTDAPTMLDRIDDYHERQEELKRAEQMDIDEAERPAEPPPEETSPLPSVSATPAPSQKENDSQLPIAPISESSDSLPPIPKSETPSFAPAESLSDPVVSLETSDSKMVSSESENAVKAPEEAKYIFPEYDAAQIVHLTSTLNDMANLNDSTRRPLPAPRWRLGWATEQADNESPVGTDKFGVAWRDDGTLFHLARPVPVLLDLIFGSDSGGGGGGGAGSGSASLKSMTNPVLAFNEESECVPIVDEAGHPKNESFQCGDVLGFAIELPPKNMDFIVSLHKHQDDELSQQDKLLKLRREVHSCTISQTYPGADLPALNAQLEEAQAQIAAIKPVPPFTPPISLQGAKLTFYKNGKLQPLALLNFPPGSYYPAVSMYYRAASIVNFGPTFAHPPPPDFRPVCELNDAYVNPLPGAAFISPAPSSAP